MTALDSATAAIASVRRASAARPSPLGLHAECRPLIELAGIADAWRDLAANAVEPNIFYEPGFAVAAAATFGKGVIAGLIWSDQTPRRLLGFFPVRIDRARYGLPLPTLVGWSHPYAPLGTPLVHRGWVEPVIAAWLDHVAHDPELPDLMLLPLMTENGAVASALSDVLARTSCPAMSFSSHQRASLQPGTQRTGYVERTLGAKRRRDLRRRERLLAEHGDVTFTEARGGGDLTAALDDFFALEASGWKGRAGTAAMQNNDVQRFMRQAVTLLADDGKAAIQRLLVSDKPVAAAITFSSGDTAWAWKIAYDEDYAACSPGTSLVLALTQAILADPAIARVDSCAAASHPLMNQVWGERLAITDRLLAVQPDRQWAFALASRLENLRRIAVRGAKSLRELLRAS